MDIELKWIWKEAVMA